MISFKFTIDTDGSIALKAKQLQFNLRVHGTISYIFGFVSQIGSFMFALKSIVVMRLITGNAEICSLSNTIFPGNVVFTEFTSYFLNNEKFTYLSSLYLD